METLNNHFRDLQGDVGFHLGYGRGADNDDTEWDAYQTKTIERVLKGGMRKFYYCGHSWSFLTPMGTVTLSEGESVAELPADFGSAQGRLLVGTDSGIVAILNFGLIGTVHQNLLAFPSNTGRPECACEEPVKGSDQTRSPKRQIRVYPLADQDYTLKFQYNLNPQYLTGQFPYAYGGPQHAETLLQACKATAEMEIDGVKAGPHFMEFMRLLNVSVQVDGRNKPSNLGYNRDLSDSMGFDMPRRNETVTFDSVTPA